MKKTLCLLFSLLFAVSLTFMSACGKSDNNIDSSDGKTSDTTNTTAIQTGSAVSSDNTGASDASAMLSTGVTTDDSNSTTSTQRDNTSVSVSDQVTTSTQEQTVTSEGASVTQTTTADNETDKKTIYNIYKNAVEKNNALNDIWYKQVIDQDMDFVMNGSSSKLAHHSETETKICNVMKSNMVFEAHYTENQGAIDSVTDIFADKNYIYVRNDADSSFKAVKRNDSSAESINALLSDEKTMKITCHAVESIKQLSMTENSDGTKNISFKLSANAADAEITVSSNRYIETLKNNGMEISDISYDEVEILIVVSRDGYVLSAESKTTMKIEMKYGGVKASVSSDAVQKTEYINLGKTVVINIPKV